MGRDNEWWGEVSSLQKKDIYKKWGRENRSSERKKHLGDNLNV
jgi:hypothetical protein